MTNPHKTTAPDHEWAKIEAGYQHVETMVPRADDQANLLWHGWALREAFIAGAEWQEARKRQTAHGHAG